MPTTPTCIAANPRECPQAPLRPRPLRHRPHPKTAQLAARVADAIATYQPINSQERDAVERIALAQHSMRRLAILEAGFFTNCLDHAMEGPARPFVLDRPELTSGIDTLEQHFAYWFAFGFNLHPAIQHCGRFFAFSGQADRRAVEDFHRLLKLRDQLPRKNTANEPNVEPIPMPQLVEDTAARTTAYSIHNPQRTQCGAPKPVAASCAVSHGKTDLDCAGSQKAQPASTALKRPQGRRTAEARATPPCEAFHRRLSHSSAAHYSMT